MTTDSGEDVVDDMDVNGSTRILPIADHWDWQLAAACRGADPDLFFAAPNERGAAKRLREEKALAVCAKCPVTARCGQFAVALRETYGAWGAMPEQELRDAVAERPGTRGRKPATVRRRRPRSSTRP